VKKKPTFQDKEVVSSGTRGRSNASEESSMLGAGREDGTRVFEMNGISYDNGPPYNSSSNGRGVAVISVYPRAFANSVECAHTGPMISSFCIGDDDSSASANVVADVDVSYEENDCDDVILQTDDVRNKTGCIVSPGRMDAK
jgi:hypothetical protein